MKHLFGEDEGPAPEAFTRHFINGDVRPPLMPDGDARPPPSALEAEEHLLGAILANNRALQYCDNLLPGHFFNPENGQLYAAIRARTDAGRLADAVTLKDEFGHDFLAKVTAAMVGIITAKEYAEVIIQKSDARQLLDVMAAARERLYDGKSDPRQIAEMIAPQIDRITAAKTDNRTLTSFAALAPRFSDNLEQAKKGAMIGLSTGIKAIDQRLRGMRNGRVYVIGGRPAMGKSALALQICINVARTGKVVIALSLEMTADDYFARAVAQESHVPFDYINGGDLDIAYAARVVGTLSPLAAMRFEVFDGLGSASQLASIVRTARRKHGRVDLIMVDHINLVAPEQAAHRSNATEVTSEAANRMLRLAKEADCPLLMLCQMNRANEARDDKRPVLSDLRQSGTIEQNAHAVGLIYRPAYYLRAPEQQRRENEDAFKARLAEHADEVVRREHEAVVFWDKVRDGKTGTSELHFDGPTMSFGEKKG